MMTSDKLQNPLKVQPTTWQLFQALALKPLKNQFLPYQDKSICYELPSMTADLKNLVRYEKLCGFTPSDFLPVTYPHIMAFRLQLYTLLKNHTPFSPFGLIHLSNHIIQYQAIPKTSEIYFTADITQSHETHLGLETTLLTKAFLNHQCVWQDKSVFLNKKLMPRKNKIDRNMQKIKKDGTQEIWQLPISLGRRYAFISKDFNPIHLFKFSAKLLGFKQAIAHGMWTKARCIAALNLPADQPIEVEVQFKAPIYLPAKVVFQKQDTAEGLLFSVCSAKKNRLHLSGKIKNISDKQ